MAQKKITDLQLISSVTDGLSVPGDNGTQSYRFTALQFFNYIASKFNALTGVTPQGVDYIPIIDSSDSNNLKKVLVSSIKNATYRSVVATDTAGVDDDTLELSGSSFDQTIPTAVGCAGKEYEFIHSGTSFSQIYTFLTTSGQTIGGLASGVIKFSVNGDTMRIRSNGANWIIVSKNTQSGLYLDTANGYGSTNNKIARYTNNRLSYGSAMTYADSAANGASVTINEPGVYCVEMSASQLVAAMWLGISLNGSALTTSISTTTYANGKRGTVFGVINRGAYLGATFYCAAGDVIRPHTDGAAMPADDNSIFKVTKVG